MLVKTATLLFCLWPAMACCSNPNYGNNMPFYDERAAGESACSAVSIAPYPQKILWRDLNELKNAVKADLNCQQILQKKGVKSLHFFRKEDYDFFIKFLFDNGTKGTISVTKIDAESLQVLRMIALNAGANTVYDYLTYLILNKGSSSSGGNSTIGNPEDVVQIQTLPVIFPDLDFFK